MSPTCDIDEVPVALEPAGTLAFADGERFVRIDPFGPARATL